MKIPQSLCKVPPIDFLNIGLVSSDMVVATNFVLSILYGLACVIFENEALFIIYGLYVV